MRRIVCWATIVLGLSAAALSAEPAAGPLPAADVEFFEKQIRPLFAEHCYQCHGEKKQESSLSLNSAAGIRRGGDRGTAIVESEPNASLLIQAVRYTDDDLKMPPRGKLRDEQIAALTEWVRRGAALPEDAAVSVAGQPMGEFNLAERRQHWSYQPIRPGEQPAVANSTWCQSPMDRYILARLEEAGLSTAGPATRRALIRRLTFDLTGLPPEPAEVAAFMADERPDAYERVVDRLLASPHYGERWGRHWLDVVRYSETLGFEFDYDLHHAWRYRDYVIRAFNDDQPFDQFVVEHLAGDLVEQPRRHRIDSTNESILATGCWWMLEGKQTPVDIRQDQTDRIDNQLDVLGKAFLGQTIACARCHDHKFDAIATRDYYALAGYLKSSRFQQAFIDAPEHMKPHVAALASRRQAITTILVERTAELWRHQAKSISDYLLASSEIDPETLPSERTARKRNASGEEEKTETGSASSASSAVEKLASERGLDAQRLSQWAKAIADESLASPDHPLHVWSLLAEEKNTSLDVAAAGGAAQHIESQRLARSAVPFVWFDRADYSGWFLAGAAFGDQPTRPGEIVIGSGTRRPIARLTSGGADSGALTLRLQGEMRSPSFTIEKNFVHLRLAGRDARVNLVIDGYTLIMNPMYGKLTVNPGNDRLVWRTIPVDRWVGHRAYFEFSDSTIPPHGLNPPPSSARTPAAPDGYIAVHEICFSDDASPPAQPTAITQWVLKNAAGWSRAALAGAFQRKVEDVIDRWRGSASILLSPLGDDDIATLDWLLENGLLPPR